MLSLDAGHAEARASRMVSATGDVRQALLSPDGTAVLLPGLTGDTAAALSTDDLSSLGEYSGAAASAAVAADGSVVTASGAQVTLHRPGSFDADRTWNLGAPTVGLHNLAWTRDRSHLFAVTADPATGLGITLHLGFDPDLTPSQLTVSAVGNPPTVQGRLTAGGVPVTGAKVRIRRGTTQVLAEPTLDSDGRFSFTDEALTPGDYTYTADFGGSDTLQPTVARSTTTVPPIRSSIAYTKVPGQVLGGQAVQLQGTFAVAAGGYDPDRAAIASWVTGPDAPGGREAATQHSGNTFEVLDTPAKPGVYTYTTWYQGDGTDAYVGGSKTTATVTVVRLATTLTLRQSTTSTVVGSAVTVHGTVALSGAPYDDGAWVHVLRYSPRTRPVRRCRTCGQPPPRAGPSTSPTGRNRSAPTGTTSPSRDPHGTSPPRRTPSSPRPAATRASPSTPTRPGTATAHAAQ
ncbi:hypothetical protein ACFQZC_22060 [Streptacidiphilus monticola]